jgi:hypothetical protein
LIPKRRYSSEFIAPAIIGQEMPEGWVWGGDKFDPKKVIDGTHVDCHKGKSLTLRTYGRHKSAFYMKKLHWTGTGYEWYPIQDTHTSNYDENFWCSWPKVNEDTWFCLHIIYADENFHWHFEES